MENAPTGEIKDDCLRGALHMGFDLVALLGQSILKLTLPVGPEITAERYLSQCILI